jgi:recombinational DNA repair protein RecR
MFLVNLQEHASIDEMIEYVEQVSPEHIILDNSKRINGKDNATYLEKKLREKSFSVSKSPDIHPSNRNF